MPLCCFKRKNTVKVGIATAVAVLLLQQSGSRNVLTLSIGADKPAWDCSFSSPCLRYPWILGGGEDRKQALFLLPNPKNKWGSIAATSKPHKHLVKPEIYSLRANSHRTLGFYQYLFTIIQTDQEIVEEKFTFLRVGTSLLPATFLNYFFPAGILEVS